MKNIAAALVKAQKEFGPALKTSNNPHFRSKYADLSACIEAVIDGLNNNGVYLMQLNEERAGGVCASRLCSSMSLVSRSPQVLCSFQQPSKIRKATVPPLLTLAAIA